MIDINTTIKTQICQT